MQKTKITSAAFGPGIAEVDTAAGRVRGIIRNGVYCYYGLKYADAERFEAPQPPAPWEGVKEAILEGPMCPSYGSNRLPAEGNIKEDPVFYAESDDCQTMKIWTPSIDSNAKKPVMFWLHGGGHAFGSSVDFDGEEMASFGDVVVVASNHRLNCLAMMNLEQYGPEFKHSCDLEFLDIIAALKWVRENISAFGGDPNNVTLFGHSGGGGKVVCLMQIAEADGLYHKAIIMAGIPPEPSAFPSKECATRIADRTMELLGISAENVQQLKTLPYDVLCPAALQAMREVSIDMGFRPTWNQPVTDLFPGHPFDVGLRPEVKDIPVFIGATRGERNCLLHMWNDDPLLKGNRHEWSEERKEQAMRLWFGDKYDEVCRLYPQVYPDRELVDAIFTDQGHRDTCMRFVDMKSAQGGAPCYMYQFTRELPINGGMVPWHGAELNFAFHRAEYSVAHYIPNGETQRIQDEMCACWCGFAHTGDPNHPGVPYLPPSTAGEYYTLIWDEQTLVRHNHDLDLVGVLPELKVPNDGNAYKNG